MSTKPKKYKLKPAGSINKNLFVFVDGLEDDLLSNIKKEGIILDWNKNITNLPERDSLNIFLVSNQFFRHNGAALQKTLKTLKCHCLIYHVGDIADPAFYPMIDSVIPEPLNQEFLLKTIKSGFLLLQQKLETDFLNRELCSRDQQLQQLADIGRQLMMEKDTSLLLDQILQKSREMTSADAGSLYLVEKGENEQRKLRFILTHNDSVTFEFEEFTMPISRESISGYVADTGIMLNLRDVYELPKEAEFSQNKSFDEKIGYRTKSMLVIPLINHRDEVIGVIQLINRKKSFRKKLRRKADFENEVISFSGGCIEMVQALAGHAAISVENNLLYASIERLFEGFVNASITAIESRDPTTHGHSSRVALLTVNLAEIVDKMNSGIYKNIKFSREQIKEIRYASLLHDFGKVGVRENVLLKAKKLYPYQLREIMFRIELLKKSREVENLRNHIDHLLKHGETGYKYRYHELESELKENLDELIKIKNTIIQVNEPAVLHSELAEEIKEIAGIKYFDPDSSEAFLLHPEELNALSIGRGSLDMKERLEIESHVTHTFNFLNKVPWTSDLQNIPEIAHYHHEKLNGKGYPSHLTANEIPVQSKMMTISDIFDALTAADRPYKKAVPFERALDILHFEVNDNHVDNDLLNIFIESKIYDSVLEHKP